MPRKARPRAPKLPNMAVRKGIGGGRRGAGIGSLQKPDLSAGNISKWKLLSSKVVTDFIYHGAQLPVHSTNVAWMQYDIEGQALTVGYIGGKKPGGVYRYASVNEAEAIDAAQAFSKGVWAWDRLRVRGSRTAHRKSFVRIA